MFIHLHVNIVTNMDKLDHQFIHLFLSITSYITWYSLKHCYSERSLNTGSYLHNIQHKWYRIQMFMQSHPDDVTMYNKWNNRYHTQLHICGSVIISLITTTLPQQTRQALSVHCSTRLSDVTSVQKITYNTIIHKYAILSYVTDFS